VEDDADGQPIQGARVQLRVPSGLATSTVKFSSPSGEFRLTDLRPGDYLLVVEQQGYEPTHLQVTVTGVSNTRVIVLMHRLNNVVTLAPGDSASVHVLSAPPKAREAFEKGIKLLNAKSDFLGGIKQFKRAIQMFPDYYEAYAQMGVAYDRSGDASSAEMAFRKSIEVSSGKYSESLFLLAEMFNEQERFADAESVAHQGIAAEPTSWRGHYELARALAGLKRNNEAEASATKARELKPDNPVVYLLLANLHMRTHNYPSLVQDLDAYLKFAPNGPASEQARNMREKVQKALEAQRPAAPTQPQP